MRLAPVVVLVACSGGGGPLDGSSTSSSGGAVVDDRPIGSSTSGASVVPAQAIATATLSGADCPNTGEVLSVGAFAEPSVQPPAPPAPVKNGETWEGDAVQVACAVKPSGDRLSVQATIARGARSIELNGTISASNPSSASSPSEKVITNVKAGGAEYASSDCTVTFPANGGVAAGRFWGVIACASVTDPAKPGACAVEAEVRIENCAQQ